MNGCFILMTIKEPEKCLRMGMLKLHGPFYGFFFQFFFWGEGGGYDSITYFSIQNNYLRKLDTFACLL